MPNKTQLVQAGQTGMRPARSMIWLTCCRHESFPSRAGAPPDRCGPLNDMLRTQASG